MQLTQDALQYIDEHYNEARELLIELAQIPAPSNHEELRAEHVKNLLLAFGAESVFIDDALNVVLPMGCEDGPVSVIMAHTDVVFPDTDPLPLKADGGRIFCPGIGDDTGNLAALLMAVKYVLERGLKPKQGVLIAANAGEEGLGNLKGARKLYETYGSRFKEVISFDAFGTHIVSRSVGSRRFRVTVRTSGGHSYNAFGNRNAIHAMAQLITELYAMPVPCRGKSTFNVGMINGGTSVNTIAQSAEMLYEFRSDSREDMDEMDAFFRDVIRRHADTGLDVSAVLIGERPCMGNVDPDLQQALVRRVSAVVEKHFGEPAFCSPGSTDCNIPLAHGVPAVTAGCVKGAGAHTREEYIEEAGILPGLRIAFEILLSYFEP